MKKLRLEVEELQVESFAVSADSGAVGTVHGASDVLEQDYGGLLGGGGGGYSGNILCISNTQCVQGSLCNVGPSCFGTCVGAPTCYASCYGSCAFTCYGPSCAPIGQQCA